MAFTDTPKIGVDLAAIVKADDVPTKGHKLGSQVWGSDGKRYVFAEAGAALTASLATVDINASTFIAAATGGTYTAPATAMATGDRGCFAKASV